jgi:hypothetical protein
MSEPVSDSDLGGGGMLAFLKTGCDLTFLRDTLLLMEAILSLAELLVCLCKEEYGWRWLRFLGDATREHFTIGSQKVG